MKQNGFTLIELLVFIIVSGLLMSVMLLGANAALRSIPAGHKQMVAIQTARRCMEWFVEQARLKGYSQLTCPSTPTIAACAVPSGYSITNTISCTTWNSDTAYKTITVSVTGLASASFSLQIGEY